MNELGDRFVFWTAVLGGLASFAMPLSREANTPRENTMKVTYRFDIRQPVITPEHRLGTVVANYTNDAGNFSLVQFANGPVVEQRSYEDRLLQPAIAPQP